MACWFHKWKQKKVFSALFGHKPIFAKEWHNCEDVIAEGYECERCGKRKLSKQEPYWEKAGHIAQQAIDWEQTNG